MAQLRVIPPPGVSEPKVATPEVAAPEVKTFWNADDGVHMYFVCANDFDHAKRILHEAGVEFLDENGTKWPVHHEAVSHPTMWVEIDQRRAERLKLHGRGQPMDTMRPGQWHVVQRRQR